MTNEVNEGFQEQYASCYTGVSSGPTPVDSCKRQKKKNKTGRVDSLKYSKIWKTPNCTSWENNGQVQGEDC